MNIQYNHEKLVSVHIGIAYTMSVNYTFYHIYHLIVINQYPKVCFDILNSNER